MNDCQLFNEVRVKNQIKVKKNFEKPAASPCDNYKIIYNRLQSVIQYSIVDKFEKSNSFLYHLQCYL